MRILPLTVALTGTLIAGAMPAAARHRHSSLTPAVVQAGIPPSQDSVELAGIAPPTPVTTVAQSYGDAAFARARAQRRQSQDEASDAAEAAVSGAPYPCDTRSATATAHVCRNDFSKPRSYKEGYVFTPSHVSAPTVFNQDPRAQSPVMPDITKFFWAVNSARIDPR